MRVMSAARTSHGLTDLVAASAGPFWRVLRLHAVVPPLAAAVAALGITTFLLALPSPTRWLDGHLGPAARPAPGTAS